METRQHIKLNNREIILIGTAHVSEASSREVEDAIRNETPDNVCIELDRSRFQSITHRSSWTDLNLGQVIKQGKGFLLLANLALSSFQKRLGLDLGTQPGAEMVRAIEVARELGIPFTLCDREIQVTLRRAWAKSNFRGRNKMLAALVSSIFSREKISPEDIEKLKKKNELENMLTELADYLPAAKTVLIDERDRYLATRIFNAPGKKIIAVVGAGHVNGIIRVLKTLDSGELSSEIQELDQIPPPHKYKKFLPWLIPFLLIVLLFCGFFAGGIELGLRMFLVWWLINGVLAALGALGALAHPVTILLAFLSAPLTSLNPLIAVGMVTGVLEYRLRRPRVRDFEALSRDIAGFKGFFKNRVTHILLVFLFSSLGSALGTFIAFPVMGALFKLG